MVKRLNPFYQHKIIFLETNQNQPVYISHSQKNHYITSTDQQTNNTKKQHIEKQSTKKQYTSDSNSILKSKGTSKIA